MAVRIFLILCMKLGDYKGRKVTQPDFWKKYWFGDICEKVSKLALVGWLVGWLVGNAVFSETALRIFLIFCMKLGDYKGRKVTELDFWKKFLIWRYSRKGLQVSPKSDTLIFFSKTALTMFLVFGQKIVPTMCILVPALKLRFKVTSSVLYVNLHGWWLSLSLMSVRFE